MAVILFLIMLFYFNSLNPMRAHGMDNIPIRMIQLCGDSIKIPLTLISKFYLGQGTFHDTSKMANKILVHKKEAKNLLTNYRKISALPIFERYYLIISFFIFIIIIFLLNASPVSCQVTLVYPS